MTPGRLPEPPRTTAESTRIESSSGKLSGVMAMFLAENMTPAPPPIDPPMAKAHSLKRKVGTPMSAAASSSSRMAAHARPTRLRSRRRATKITTTMRARTR